MTPRNLSFEPQCLVHHYKGFSALPTGGKYEKPSFFTPEIAMTLYLDPEHTKVQTLLSVQKNPEVKEECPLVLDGKCLSFKSIRIDGKPLSSEDYKVDETHLTLVHPPQGHFLVEIVNEINPRANTDLHGMYESKCILCSHCEPDGFSHITYSIDRPDNPSIFDVTLVADILAYPVLLSNGNCIQQGDLQNNRHFAKWHDPFPKPSYLFAIVAGKLQYLEDSYITQSGKKITLRVFADNHNISKCHHALECIKKAMAWDEKMFGFEYDLEIFNVVGVEDFNAGAMENKSLNIFNAPALLATPDTATDDNYMYVQQVVGHEYFHNYRGDRVTICDWRQLALKEAFTEFSTQWFAQDVLSPMTRIEHIDGILDYQFPEDQGPLAHPIIPPEDLLETPNLYTATVYDKGSEVFRTLRNLLGIERFLQGVKLFYKRYDGKASHIEEFMQTMEEATHADLKQFRLWFYQAGTPQLSVTTQYDKRAGTFTLHFKQTVAPTPKQPHKQPLHIPVEVALLGRDGREMPLHLQNEGKATETTRRMLEIKQTEETFVFTEIPQKPVPSVLRDFSAPVQLEIDLSYADLVFLFQHDSDLFNRWDAVQRPAEREALRLIKDHQEKRVLLLNPELVKVFRTLLCNKGSEPLLVEKCLSLPSEHDLAQKVNPMDVEAIHFVREFMTKTLAENLTQELESVYFRNSVKGPYQPDPIDIGKRSLRNVALSYLMSLNTPETRWFAKAQLSEAQNLTERYTPFVLLVHSEGYEREREILIRRFYEAWKHEALVVNKWLSALASSPLPGTLNVVKELLSHPAFEYKNPDKVRALIGVFSRNLIHFHDASGSGYEFLAEQIQKLDGINKQVAARLANAFSQWKRLDGKRQEMVKAALKQIQATPNLSSQVKDIVNRLLGE